MVSNETPRKKRFALKVFGIIALAGIALMLVGALMGGRWGTITAQNDRLVYQTSKYTVDLGDAPRWMRNNSIHMMDGYSIFSWNTNRSRSTLDVVEEPAVVEDVPAVDADEAGGNRELFGGHSQTLKNGTLLLGEYDYVNIAIDCGYVTVQPGVEASITANGPLSCDVYTQSGILYIQSDHHLNGIDTRNVSGKSHFFKGNEDITTYYTITLPVDTGTLEVELGIGKADIGAFSLDYFTGEVSLGDMNITDLSADYAEFSTSLGNMTVTGYNGGGAELSCELGALDFAGDVDSYLKVNCELGSVNALLPRPADYGYNIENSMGSIILDGRSFAGFSTQASSSGGSMSFDLECEMGSVIVEFS